MSHRRARGSRTPDDAARRAWPQLRAVLVALHVVAVVVLSFPSAGRIADRGRWKSERNQREIGLWAKRLTGLGWSVTHAELDSQLWAAATRYLAVREGMARPLAPYVAIAGTGQVWGLFRAPQRRPGELRIEIDEGSGFRAIHVSRSSEHDWRWWQLGHNRFRKQLGRIAGDSRLFDQLARWLGDRAFEDFPRARSVRILYDRFEALAPDADRSPPPRRTQRRLLFHRGGGT